MTEVNGAGSGEPAVAADEAGSNPAGNPAPSSPHHGPAVCAIASEFMARYKGTPIPDGFALDAAQAGLVAALPHLQGATPAVDREALEQAIERGAIAADLAKYFLPGDMGKFVNEVMPLIAGAP